MYNHKQDQDKEQCHHARKFLKVPQQSSHPLRAPGITDAPSFTPDYLRLFYNLIKMESYIIYLFFLLRPFFSE